MIMDNEKIGKICEESIKIILDGIREPISSAVANALCQGYEEGWKACLKQFNINIDFDKLDDTNK